MVLLVTLPLLRYLSSFGSLPYASSISSYFILVVSLPPRNVLSLQRTLFNYEVFVILTLMFLSETSSPSIANKKSFTNRTPVLLVPSTPVFTFVSSTSSSPSVYSTVYDDTSEGFPSFSTALGLRT